jgi:hypothetical protein
LKSGGRRNFHVDGNVKPKAPVVALVDRDRPRGNYQAARVTDKLWNAISKNVAHERKLIVSNEAPIADIIAFTQPRVTR